MAGVTKSAPTHAPVTLGAGSDPSLALAGQQLTLADVLTPAEHTAIGDAAPHHAPVTIGVDAEHSLAGQVLSGVDAAAVQKGHLQLAGELGGTAALPTVTAIHSGSAHHVAITLGGGSDLALALVGQQLTLADVLTPAEHTAIGNAAPHHAPVTIGVDVEHSLVGQVLSGVDAAAAQKGHLQLAGELGGTAALPTVTAIHSGSAHHVAITLGGGSDLALALVGQQLTLADVLTPAEHTAIGNGAPHHAQLHGLLSASHSDTLPAAVLDGDVIMGNVTPAWSRLAINIPAANVRNVFGIDNAELRPSWKTALDATNPADIAAAASPGISLVFAHRDHVHAHPNLGDLHTGYLLATGARVGASAQAQDFGTFGIKADLGVESTLNAGMTLEGVLLKDGALPSPTINGTIATTGLTLPAFISGSISLGSGTQIKHIADNDNMNFQGGTDVHGGYIVLFGKSHASFPGEVWVFTPNAALAATMRLQITGAANAATAIWTNCKQIFDAASLPNGDPGVSGQLYYTAADGLVRRSA